MLRNKTICVFFVASIISGCAAVSPANDRYEKNSLTICIASFTENLNYSAIGRKVVLGNGTATEEMLGNTSKVSSSDKPVLQSWAVERDGCYSSNVKKLETTMSSEHAYIEADTFAKTSLLISQLYTGVISYGELAKSRNSINTASRQAHKMIDDNERDKNRVVMNLQRDFLVMQALALRDIPATFPLATPAVGFGNPTIEKHMGD